MVIISFEAILRHQSEQVETLVCRCNNIHIPYLKGCCPPLISGLAGPCREDRVDEGKRKVDKGELNYTGVS